MKQVLFVLLMISFQAKCQYNNNFSIPGYDCGLASEEKLMSSKKIIFVFPGGRDSLTYVEWTKSWVIGFQRLGVECTVKFEKELSEEDKEKPMLILGTINSFIDWTMFDTPVKQIRNGFSFGEMVFTGEGDAIFYISDTNSSVMRLVITGNSISSLRPIVNNMRTGYSYLIFNDGMIDYFGNCTGNEFDFLKNVHLSDLKSKYYQAVKAKYYDFYISSRLADYISTYKVKLDSFDLFVDYYTEVMQVKSPDYRIPCFIHFDQEEISYISTHFNHLCGGRTAGVVTGNEIHSNGFAGAIEHETSHIIFNTAYNANASTFFSEGIVQYFEFMTDTTRLSEGYITALEFIDENIMLVISGEEDFFQGNKYYRISGIFVKYLVDNRGLEMFKQFYKADDVELGFQRTYDMKLEQALHNYKEWLRNIQ